MADERYFLQICDNLGFICLALEPDLTVRFANKEAVRQFASSGDQLNGRSFLDLLQEPDRAAARQLLQKTMDTGLAGEMEIRYLRDDEQHTTMVLIISPIRDPQGACIGVSASMRDISERKRLASELGRARRMAALGNMAAAIVHHFNNIFGGMQAGIDVALKSESIRELRQTLRLLSQSISRATRITNQLATFAESENAQDQPAEVEPLLRRIIERIGRRAQGLNVHFESDIQPIPRSVLEANRVTSIIESISQNAFDAMPNGGTLTISVKHENDFLVIRITDTGTGISEEDMEHLFEPFFTTKGGLGEKENIGLGLAAVHGLVSDMGGSISVSSRVGQGTTIMIRLPIRRESDRLKDPPAATQVGSPPNQ